MSDTETAKAPDPYPKADLTDFDSAVLLGANIIIQKWTPEEMSDGGIVLVSGAQQDQAVGWIVKVGNLVPPGDFAIGDTVIFPRHAIQALPEVGGRDDAAKHFTEYNYMRAEDVVLRYPLNPIGDIRRGESATAAQARSIIEQAQLAVDSAGMEAPA